MKRIALILLALAGMTACNEPVKDPVSTNERIDSVGPGLLKPDDDSSAYGMPVASPDSLGQQMPVAMPPDSITPR